MMTAQIHEEGTVMCQTLRVRGVIVALFVALLAMPPAASAAHHEKVLQVVAVQVKPGKLEDYRKQVAKLRAVIDRVGASSTLRMWNATQAGPNTGTVLVALEWKNADTWAAESGKVQGDPEWQKIVSGLHEIRTLAGSALWREITPNPAESPKPGSGGVLVTTAVDVEPGMLAEYKERLSKGQSILERLELKGAMRMWQAELAGANTGSVVVGVEYPDLSTYVSEQSQLNGDAEWQELLGGLSDIRSLAGRSMYQEITP
jgi:hypothetical protein